MATIILKSYPELTACIGAFGGSPVNGGLLYGFSSLTPDGSTSLDYKPECSEQIDLISSAVWDVVSADTGLTLNLTQTQLAGALAGVMEVRVDLSWANLVDDTTYNAILRLTTSYPTGTTQVDTGLIRIFKTASANAAPVVHGRTVIVDNRTTLIIAIGDHISYSDAENDPLDVIRIDTLPPCGILKLSGTPVTLNQIITAVDINANNFVFESPDQDALSSCAFNFSAKAATGNTSWVS